MVEEAKENPVVKAVEKELGATLETVSETDGYENVYDGDANLIHGFDDIDTLKFVFPEDCSLTKQEAYVDKHLPAILKNLNTTDELEKLLNENVFVFHNIAAALNLKVTDHIHLKQIGARKREIKEENS